MRLVDWNIQWGRGVDGRVDLARIVREAESLCDFDVLCVQELSRRGVRVATAQRKAAASFA